MTQTVGVGCGAYMDNGYGCPGAWPIPDLMGTSDLEMA